MSGRFARSARIAMTAGGAVLLVLGLALWGLAHSGAVDAWLTARIAALLGPQVRFTTARAVWWPRPGVVLDDVALVPAEARAGNVTAATAVTCRLGLRALLTGRVQVAALQVDGLRITVERAADGSLHTGGLERLAAAAPGGDAGPTALPPVQVRDAAVVLQVAADGGTQTVRMQPLDAQLVPSGAGARFAVDAQVDGGGSVRASGAIDALDPDAHFNATLDADQLDAAAVLAWLPAATQRASVAGRLRLTATLAGRARAAIDGDGSLELADGGLAASGWQIAAPLRLAAHASWNGTALALTQGRLDAARLSRTGLAAEAVEATFEYGDGTLRVATAQLRACGGTWRPAGRVTLGDPPSFDATLAADDVDAAQLAAVLGAFGAPGPLPRFASALRLSAAGNGAVGGDWSGRASIETNGAVSWAEARADGPLLLAADVQAHGAAIALSNGRLQARRVALGAVAADAVEADFAYADGALRVTPLRGNAFGGAWTYTGTLPVAATTSWRGTLTATRVSAAALRNAFDPPGPGEVTDGIVQLDAQLTGTGTDPISATASTHLQSAALSWDALRVSQPLELSGALRLQGGRLTFSDGRARIAGGRLYGSGAAALRGAPSWSATVEAKHIDPDALLDALDGVRGVGPRTVGAVADVSLTLTRGPDGTPQGSATVALATGRFVWDDLHVDGPAHFRGTFRVGDEAIALTQVAADAARAAFGPLVSTAAKGQFQYGGDRLSFADLRFHACGGTWKYSGWFDLAPGGQFAGQLGMEGAAPQALAAMLDSPDFAVPFARLDLDSEFDGRATSQWLSTLRATGSVFLSNGTMRAATVLGPIWEALVGTGRVGRMLDRTTHVERISDSFALRRSRVDTPDFSLISDDFNVSAHGSLGLDGSLDLDARIQLTAQGAQRLLTTGSLPLPTFALPSLPPIPAHIGGDLAAPVIRPNVSALPASTVAWLVDAALHTPRALGGAIVDGLGSLWNGAKRALGAAGPAPQP